MSIWYCRCSAATPFPFDPGVKGSGNSAGLGIKVMILLNWSTLVSLFPYTFSGGPQMGGFDGSVLIWALLLVLWLLMRVLWWLVCLFLWSDRIICMLVFFCFFVLKPLKFRAENGNWVDLWWSSVRLRNIYSPVLSNVTSWSQYLSSEGHMILSMVFNVDHKAICSISGLFVTQGRHMSWELAGYPANLDCLLKFSEVSFFITIYPVVCFNFLSS